MSDDPLKHLDRYLDAIPPGDELKNLRTRAEAALNKPLFFVSGALKSGTTWVQLMLDAHPEIACRGEGHLANYLLPGLGNALQKYNNKIGFKNRTIFREIDGFPRFKSAHHYALFQTAVGLLLAQFDDSDIRIIGEKSPDNVLYLELLGRIFPEARILHVLRDGRDGAVSGWFHNLRISKDWAEREFGDFSGFAEHYAQVWAKNLRAGRAFGMENPERYCEIRYEDLLADGETQLRRILDFLGARSDTADIRNCLEASSFSALANGRTAGEENRQSHFRKGIHGDWRAHFNDRSLANFQVHAGTELKDLGYDD
jgi:hypothetical protein